METALSIVRFLHYSAAIQLFGTAIFETWIASKPLSDSLLSLSRRIAVFNAWLLFLSAVAWLGFEAGYMGEGWGDVLNPATIWLVVTATGFAGSIVAGGCVVGLTSGIVGLESNLATLAPATKAKSSASDDEIQGTCS